MRVLQIEKFFYNRGGASKVFFETIDGLRKTGNVVAEFSMLDEKNFTSDYAEYFSAELPDFHSRMSLVQKWRVFWHLFYSRDVNRKLGRLIKDFRPHIAHIHNAYHHLSASSFLTLRKNKIPTVLTLHDFFPLCPNHSFMLGEKIAEDVLGNRPCRCVRYRCVNGKFFPSLAGGLEAIYYRARGIWENIDVYICPSLFIKNKFIEYGFPEKKMKLLRNPIELSKEVPELGNRILFMGRIHAEKGIKTLLKAATELRGYEIDIVGRGPDEQFVREYREANQLSNVRLHHWVSGKEWERMMNGAKVVVVPSVFYENCSIGILEAMNRGRIVVASDRGGNPELVINNKTGFLFKAEDSHDLARALKEAMDLPKRKSAEYIENARNLLLANHSPEKYLEELIKIYKGVIRANSATMPYKIKV